ncbi:MAG: CaiB/BaiF CoA transferase family protein [Dehalococcoidia bacterium]
MASPAPVPHPHPSGPLAGYRVLDFADEKGQLAARLLGELGADVIKVEPPRDGDPTRANGPFYRGDEGIETSLYWWAMNAGKRSITCQPKLQAGRELVHRLVQTSDIVIETNAPGKAKGLGLDYETLSAVNRGVVVLSVTNFGQTGPYRDWQATDMIGVAIGGHMYLNGDPERGPVRTLAPQAFAQVNTQAAVGAMIALYARGTNGGLGQHVDASMQEAVANAMDNAQQTWDIRRINNRGPGDRRMIAGAVGPKYLYEASDGWVTCLAAGGLYGPGANAIIDWLAESGEAAGLDGAGWRARLSALEPIAPEELAHLEATLAAFCRTRPKEALVAEAQRRGAGWAPVFSPREVVESAQLAAREYWVAVTHDDLGETFIYPGAPWKLSKTPWMQRGRAPHLGEHNGAVYGGLLGIAPDDLRRMKLRMVI